MQKLLITILMVLCCGPAWGATYYVSPTGSGTDCTQSAPCGLAYALSTKASTNGDNVYLLPGIYPITTQITQNSTNTTGIVQSYDHSDKAIIDGTTMSGNSMIYTYGGTYQYLVFRNASNASKPAIKIQAGSTTYLYDNTFLDNQVDVLTQNSTLTAQRNVFENPVVNSIQCDISSPNALNLSNNLFVGRSGTTANIFIRPGNVTGQFDIFNNIFAGAGAEAIDTGSTFSGTINIENNLFLGNSVLGDASNIDINGTGIAHAANNAYVGAGLSGLLSNGVEGVTDASPQTDKRLYMGYRTPSYSIVRGDDLEQSATYRANHISVAATVNSAGGKTVHGIVVGHAATDDWAAAAALIEAGNEIAVHGWSHMSMDNDAGNTYPFGCTYSGAGTASITISASGTAPNDVVSLRLQESVTGDDCTINLGDGTSTGAGCPADTSAANISGLRTWLDGKSYLACTAIDSDMNYPSLTFSRILKSGSYSLSGSASNFLFDVPRTHYYEMAHAKMKAEEKLLLAGKSYTITTFIYPNYHLDTTAKSDLLFYGYTAALGTNSTGTTATGLLENLDMFDLPTAQAAGISANTQLQIENYARAQAAAFTSGQKIGGLMFHWLGTGELQTNGWGYYINEMMAQPGITNLTPKTLVSKLAENGWTTNNNGATYTKKLSGVHHFSIAANSPAIGAGSNDPWTGVASAADPDGHPVTDSAGNVFSRWIDGVEKPTVDIGAYQYPSDALSITADGAKGGYFNTAHPYSWLLPDSPSGYSILASGDQDRQFSLTMTGLQKGRIKVRLTDGVGTQSEKTIPVGVSGGGNAHMGL